jgi:hypothetical protein
LFNSNFDSIHSDSNSFRFYSTQISILFDSNFDSVGSGTHLHLKFQLSTFESAVCIYSILRNYVASTLLRVLILNFDISMLVLIFLIEISNSACACLGFDIFNLIFVD